jgi:succinate-semialdehyde dehydrogenase / glutarate-semialdehyde dehydrogenase
MAFKSINPHDGSEIATFEEMGPQAVNDAIEKAHAAFLSWRGVPYAQRAPLMRGAARILRAKAREYGRLMAQEMGKPIRGGIAEAEKCASCCDYFADNAEKFLAREAVATEASESFVTFNPLGVVLAVMPWNFPFWQVFRFAAPGLMAGNAAVLKHASNVPGCALAIEGIFRDAGFPENLFRALMIQSRAVGSVIAHPRVRAATLTGSSAAGRDVAAKAGAVLKKTVLELGGSDAYLVLEDADLTRAADISVRGRLVNSGQSCIAAKRFIVVEKVRAEYERLFVERMRAVKMGDPLDEANEVGPLARRDLRETLHRQVQESLAKGARLLLGGTIPEGSGNYYPPTILTDVRKGMPAFDEELFGPVAAIVSVKDEEAAIAAANDSKYGLGGCVITRDVRRGAAIAAERIESGCVFVNEPVRSDSRLPFGGVKESGYGRELSHYGIKEFVNVKTVYVA